MTELSFEIQGVTARVGCVSSSLAPVLELLQRDFAAFATSTSRPHVHIELTKELPTATENFPRVAFRLPITEVRGWSDHRICTYPDGVAAETRTIEATRHFYIAGKNINIVHEVAYTILHSALGEELDARGFHRAHALGIEVAGVRALMLAPSGFGKSALATLLTRREDTRLFSDENPLLRGRYLHPFPIRLALAPEAASAFEQTEDDRFQRHRYKPKSLFAFPATKQAEGGLLDVLLVAKRTTKSPSIQRRPRVAALPALVSSLVVGIGLAQMAEWMLRWNAFGRLTAIFFRRVSTAFRILAGPTEVYRFNMTANAFDNVRCLDEFLRARASSQTLRLRDPLQLTLLLTLDRGTRSRAFRPLHEAVRVVYRGPLTAFLQSRLRRQASRLRLIPRHSATTPGRFSLFRSDIDYSAVLSGDTSAATFSRVIKTYERWQKSWLFLGEMEMYTEDEYRIQGALEKSHGELLNWIKTLRKWARVKNTKHLSIYHREKDDIALASMKHDLTAGKPLETGIEEFLETRFGVFFQPVTQASWTSAYLGWTLGENGLALRSEPMAVLLSLLPDWEDAPAVWKPLIEQLRRKAVVASAYAAVAANEFIVCRSVARTGGSNAGLERWMRSLRTDIQTFDPKLAETMRPLFDQIWTPVSRSERRDSESFMGNRTGATTFEPNIAAISEKY